MISNVTFCLSSLIFIASLQAAKPSQLVVPAIMQVTNTLHTNKRFLHSVRNIPLEEKYKPPFACERKRFYKLLRTGSSGPVAHKYIRRFQQTTYRLMHEFSDLSGLTPLEWCIGKFYFNKRRVTSIEFKKGAPYIVPSQLQQTIEQCSKRCCIDPKKIRVFITEANDLNMAASQSALIIDKKAINIDDDLAKAMLFHEMQHILHDDSFSNECLMAFYDLNKNIIDQKKFEAFKKKYNQFREKRADIIAGLIDEQTLNGLIKLHTTFNYPDSPSHPAAIVRTAYLKKLRREINMVKK